MGRRSSGIESGWQREFEDPVELPDGRTLTTLREAADYITALPKKEAELPEWQVAIEGAAGIARRTASLSEQQSIASALSNSRCKRNREVRDGLSKQTVRSEETEAFNLTQGLLRRTDLAAATSDR